MITEALQQRYRDAKRNYGAHIKHLALTNGGEMSDFRSDNTFICEIIVGDRSFTNWDTSMVHALKKSLDEIDEVYGADPDIDPAGGYGLHSHV